MPDRYSRYGWSDKEFTERGQQAYQREAVRRVFWRCCLNCDHWDDGKVTPGTGQQPRPEGCSKFGGQKPPAEIILMGCDSHEESIPF